MRIATLALIVGAASVASANTGHHSSGGGGGSSEAACLRWEPIPVDMAGADMATVDMAGADMAGPDLGGASFVLDGGAPADMRAADPHAGMRCVERAGLFSCSFGSSGGDAWGGVALLAIAALTLSREHRRRRRRG
ncbi:MAG: hypothetical protein ACXVDD_21540 [Polyangia bacterium]